MTVVILLERQTADASRLNALLNDPLVRPWIANGDHIIDVALQVSNPRNLLLLGEKWRLLQPLADVETTCAGLFVDHLKLKRTERCNA